MKIKIQTVKVTKSHTFFEMRNGNCTVTMISTEKNVKPLSFRVSRQWYYEELQLMRMLQFAGVENTDELQGKDIKAVITYGENDNDDEHVVGFGSMKEDKFFLIEYQDIKDFTQAEIEELARLDSEYLKRTVI